MLLEGLLLLYSSFLFHRARWDVVSGWVIMLVYARRGLSFRPLFRIVAHKVLRCALPPLYTLAVLRARGIGNAIVQLFFFSVCCYLF